MPTVPRLPYAVISRLLGLFLLASAGLKIHGLTVDRFAEDSLFGSPRLLIATIEIEIVLGIWLLSGWSRRASWLAGLGFFAVVACASLYMAIDGQKSCGCFGEVRVHPWITFTVDLIAIAALIPSRPAEAATFPISTIRGTWRTALGGMTCIGLVGGVFVFASDQSSAMLARLRGEPMTVDPGSSWIGEGIAGEERIVRVELVNHGDEAIQVIGGTANCSCITTADLPTLVAPHESRVISIAVSFKGGTGRFQRSFILYTGNKQQPIVKARFAGRVVQASGS